MKIIVYHAGYGCDTGCCGHVVESEDGRNFHLGEHPNGDDYLEFAKDLVRSEYGEEHVKDLDWDNSFVTDSC